jgi:ribose transport system permease protein
MTSEFKMKQIPSLFKKGTTWLKRFQSLTGLVLIIFMAIILSPRQHGTGHILFLTSENISDIFRQVSENGIIAIGMTFVILTSGIDLSVGSLLAVAATFSAKILTQWDPPFGQSLHLFLAIFLPLVLTTSFGTIYGLVISKLKIQPFIITLAGMIGIRGFARFLTNNANIDIGFGDDISSVFANLLSPKPVVISTFVIAAIVMSILLSRTVFGLRVKSIGDNSIGSRYAGLPVTKIILLTYALSGFLTGIAGILHAAQNHQGSPNDGMSYELDAIAAVVIGGTRMTGGKGSILGTIIGVFIMGILTNTFRLKGVDINIEMMAKAIIIVIAVWLQMPRQGKNKG